MAEGQGVVDAVARERASSAHKRLDTINGQIDGLRTAQETALTEARAGDEKRDEQHSDLRVEVAKVKTRTAIYAGLAAFVASGAVAIGAALLASHENRTTPAVSAPKHVAQSVAAIAR